MFIKKLERARASRPSLHRYIPKLALILFLSPGAVHSHAADSLTLDRALRLAQACSAQLVAQDAAASAARDMAAAAGQLPDPTLQAGINNLPVNGADQFSTGRDFMTMRSIGVMQEFTRSEKRTARAAHFEREAEAAEAGHALAMANVKRDTAMAWLDRYYQERMQEELAAQRDDATQQIEAADAAYRGARGSQADVLAARAAAAQIDDRIADTERQIATAKIQLARWIGDEATQPLGEPPAIDTVSLSAADLQEHLVHHPQIALMIKQEQMAQADAQLARANEHSDWSWQLMYSQRGSGYSNLVSINVSIPVQWDRKNRQDRELSAKLALVEQMRAEREDASREHAADALTMLQQWQSNRDRLVRYDDSLIPLATERTQAAIAAYRGGSSTTGGTLVAVLDARRSQIDTRMDRLRLQMETARLWAQLNYLFPAGHDTALLPNR